MKCKKILAFIIALIVSTSAIAFGSQTQFSNLSFGFVSNFFKENAQADIPDHVLYDKLFRMTFSLNEKSKSEKISVEKRNGLANYLKNRAKLNNEENQILQSAASEYIQQVNLIDEPARTIIEQSRNAVRSGLIPRDQPPPVELLNLQKQRDELALRYRDRLRESLGADVFAKFDEFVKGDFASRIRAIPLSSVNFDQNSERRLN